jgi:nitroimidazol reductase NimA-like FMN-containing flavoprotein (pyridoxamine 5'-phosphate oxidase superfamily)
MNPAECWELLATQRVGRVAVIVGHYPLVFPVKYAVDDKKILYRTCRNKAALRPSVQRDLEGG